MLPMYASGTVPSSVTRTCCSISGVSITSTWMRSPGPINKLSRCARQGAASATRRKRVAMDLCLCMQIAPGLRKLLIAVISELGCSGGFHAVEHHADMADSLGAQDLAGSLQRSAVRHIVASHHQREVRISA